MTTQKIIEYSTGAIFIFGIAIALFIAYRRGRLSTPLTKHELVRRSALRLGFLTVPYLLLAWLWQTTRGDDVLFHGWWFWFAVVLAPGLGFALDFWRLPSEQQTK